MKGVLTIILLVMSNSFMTLAWYGHLVGFVFLILAVYFIFKD